jgi:hypothetical protein
MGTHSGDRPELDGGVVYACTLIQINAFLLLHRMWCCVHGNTTAHVMRTGIGPYKKSGCGCTILGLLRTTLFVDRVFEGESVLLPDMIVVAAPRMRDVVDSGCKLVERG